VSGVQPVSGAPRRHRRPGVRGTAEESVTGAWLRSRLNGTDEAGRSRLLGCHGELPRVRAPLLNADALSPTWGCDCTWTRGFAPTHVRHLPIGEQAANKRRISDESTYLPRHPVSPLATIINLLAGHTLHSRDPMSRTRSAILTPQQ
jgi:hypothetical protein